MNRKDRIVYKELSESSALRLAAVQKSQGEFGKESKIVIRELYFFALNSRYTLTLYMYSASSCKDEHVRSLNIHTIIKQLIIKVQNDGTN